MKDSIVLSREHHLAILTFNRPSKNNAFNYEMCERLEELCQEINADDSIRIVLMRGNGEAFTTGTDINELNQDLESISNEALFIIRQFNSCILLLREMEKVVIVSVHGMVAGIGMSLMLAADMVIARDDTRFSLGYNQMAISAIGASSYMLPRIIGAKKAMELFLMPDVFDAAQAYDFGLVNWIVSKEEMETQTKYIIERIVNGPMVAFMQTKLLLNSAWQNKLSAQLELEAEAFVRCVNTNDFKTAVRAYVNKQIPEFEGR
jgi:2-(1,2-epoxy-1,2-dihydrophenyl)acetyl-CoA isomerase